MAAPRVESAKSSLLHINWALNADRPLHTAPFHVGPRNLVVLSISIQLDISVPRVAHTHEAPELEGDREPRLLTPPIKSGRDLQRIGDPPARQGLLFKSAHTTGDIARFSLSSPKGINESNAHTAIQI
jgi:hypothetical protein